MSRLGVLVIEDDLLLNHLLVENLQKIGYEAEGVGTLNEARHYLTQKEVALLLLDAHLPDGTGMELLEKNNLPPVVFLTAYGSIREAVSAMKAGATEYLVKPINLDELEVTISRVLETQAMKQDYQFCKAQVQKKSRSKVIVGQSPQIEKVHELIRAVAPTGMGVLVQGESGSGKELVAADIHKHSERAQRNYVALDCCSLQERLFESELFGHEKGSFTGADRQKKGLIEAADGGTLFLDEIGEIEPSIQAKLLRVLETGHFRRLGGTKDLSSNVRIIAATNCNLEKMSEEGTFRLDLYYRLSAFVITIPPLRERRDDIPELMNHFLQNHTFSRRINKQFTHTALKELVAYHWPGNVRELKNVVERAIILSGDKPDIRPEHLTFSNIRSHRNIGFQLNFDHEPTLEEIERDYLRVLLNKYSGHRLKVAEALGVSERNTYRLLKKHALS
ncbi:MAG: sigma-54 dependent transcriptional regulator [Thiotrichaceae bacterium]|nr:sigma-54 dependent transcriptional regulator [Thiotrichaceae bacterium]MEC4317429.1 sigma-54 dependent transcriptional regulator [Thiotrichaceae bacterium]